MNEALVKSKKQVEDRLKKLRVRYARKHMEASQKRCFKNCVHNHAHVPTQTPAVARKDDFEMVPRRQVTLVVLQDEDPTVHLCMYGASDPATWPGDVCDDDSVARGCKVFEPRQTADQAKEEFLSSLSDDEHVFNNYRDVATLQWVLGERVHSMGLSIWERFLLWLRSKLIKRDALVPQLPESSVPDDLWSENQGDTAQSSGPRPS